MREECTKVWERDCADNAFDKTKIKILNCTSASDGVCDKNGSCKKLPLVTSSGPFNVIVKFSSFEDLPLTLSQDFQNTIVRRSDFDKNLKKPYSENEAIRRNLVSSLHLTSGVLLTALNFPYLELCHVCKSSMDSSSRLPGNVSTILYTLL